MIKISFWFCFALLSYIYLGYPALIWVLAKLFPKPVKKAPFEGKFSIVIVAYNEADVLPAKLRSILSAEGLEHLEEIVVASDGSTDGTVELIREFDDSMIRKRLDEETGRDATSTNPLINKSTNQRIRLVDFPERRGKAAVLNDVIPQCESEIVVLTDARQEIDPAAFINLLANFNDETVGVVSGELVFENGAVDSAAASGVGAYWNYEKFIRRNESMFGSVPGATGALYAIRRSLFKPIPETTLVDDVAIPMRIVADGHRCVFEPSAIVFDAPSTSSREEAVRKRRTIAGVAQLASLYPGWLLPWRNPIWFQYVSHKFVRLLSPFLLVAIAVLNITLARQQPYVALAWCQGAFYLSAAVGWLLSHYNLRVRWLGVPTMFVALNMTTLLALGDAARGRYVVVWQK